MYNVNTGMVPRYIPDLIPPLFSEMLDYFLRNNRNVSVHFNTTHFSQNHVFHHSLGYGTPLKMTYFEQN